MKTANVAEAVKSEHAVALLKQMYGENRVEENADRKSTRLNSSHTQKSRMPSSA